MLSSTYSVQSDSAFITSKVSRAEREILSSVGHDVLFLVASLVVLVVYIKVPALYSRAMQNTTYTVFKAFLIRMLLIVALVVFDVLVFVVVITCLHKFDAIVINYFDADNTVL